MVTSIFSYPAAVSLAEFAANPLIKVIAEHGLWIACVLATLQHSIYASVFFVPSAARFLSKNHSTFVPFCYALKISTVVAMLSGAVANHGLPCTYTNLCGLGWFLVVYGCSLNIHVHAILGTTGIYYGYELGLITKEQFKVFTEYPYNLFNHPQYLGASLQIIGGVAMWGFNSDATSRIDVLAAGLYMVALYLITIQIEKLPSSMRPEHLQSMKKTR